MIRSLITGFGCTFCLISPQSLAQTPELKTKTEAQTTTERDTIIVTGTRLPTPLDQIGRSVSVITSVDIETRQQRFVFDALQSTPGVQGNRSGSFGSLSTVSIRGLPSGQTLVVQDGVVQNNPSSFANSFNFANFDTSDIERIEVLRGAQSTLYGSDAIGGVINIVTKDGSEGFGGSAFVEGGSFNTFRGSASLRGGTEILSGRITISGVTTDGFSTADEANGNTENDGFENITLSSKVRYAPIDTLSVDAVIRYSNSENEFDGFAFGVGAIDADEVAETEEISVAGFITHRSLGDKFENRLSITYLRNDQLNLSSGVASFDAVGERIAYEYQATLRPLDAISIVAGAEYEEQESTVAIGFGGNQKIKTTSGFGLVQIHPLSFVTLNAGIRHDDSSDFGSETTFSVSGAAEAPATGTILRASYAEGFRAPTAGELSFNPNLFPEVSDGWDIGIEQPFLNERLRLQAVYFDQQIDQLIAFDLAAFTFVNIQEFSSKGVEISAQATVSGRLSVSAAYTYIDAVNLSTNIGASNQPDNRFNFEIDYRPTAKLSLSTGVTFNGSELSGATTLDSFTLVNIRGTYMFSENFDVFVRVENAIDTNYQDNFGFGTAPISAFGGVRARF